MARFTTSDGVALEHAVHHADGDLTPIVLVMGYIMPGHVWRFVVPHLDPRRPVLWWDHRGAGRSDAPDPKRVPYTMARLAQDGVELMDHLGWERAHVVGVSMGGMVAQRLTLDHPERVASLALIATHAGGRLANFVPRARGVWHFVRSMTRRGPGRFASLARLLFPEGYRREVGERRLLDVLAIDLAIPSPPAGRKGQLQAVGKHDARARLHELGRVPTLVVKPELDLLIHPRCSDELHRGIPGSTLVTYADAGHGLVRQHGEALGRAILDNIARAPGEAAPPPETAPRRASDGAR
ncbi:MAG: alpha/beta fold hydrolase [Deltaproteobacteria bacterium]|nr:alpha/beta fold hydrolase [Deltaproteobacteria bacterium]